MVLTVRQLSDKAVDSLDKLVERVNTEGKKTTEKKAPKKKAPKKEAPKKEAPKKEAPKKEAPKKEAPKKEAPKKDGPKREPSDYIKFTSTYRKQNPNFVTGEEGHTNKDLIKNAAAAWNKASKAKREKAVELYNKSRGGRQCGGRIVAGFW
jgi:hypothetical protein